MGASLWSAAWAWLVTFAVHSTALLLGAWALVTVWRRLPDLWQEAVWRSALFGALATATLQFAVVPEPAAGILARTAPIRAEIHGMELVRDATPVAVPEASADSPIAWSHWLVGAAALAAALGLGHGVVRRARLARLLRDRRPLAAGDLPVLLTGLCERAGIRRAVRLSESPRLRSPVAFGILRPEICVPAPAARQLAAGEAEGMLAHELAHVLHLDDLWRRACGLVHCLFPWQPLVRVARRKLAVLAEYRCDAVGAELAGELAVARCLVEVASWRVRAPEPVAAGLLGMAAAGSALEARVERLLTAAPQCPGRHRRWVVPTMLVALATSTLALPGASWRSPATHAATVAEGARDGPLDNLSALLGAECDLLVGEFEALRHELGEAALDDETRSLLQELEARIQSLVRRRVRIEAAISELTSRTKTESTRR